jgi:hypothetical protein
LKGKWKEHLYLRILPVTLSLSRKLTKEAKTDIQLALMLKSGKKIDKRVVGKCPRKTIRTTKKKGENMIDTWKLDPIWRQQDITVCCWLLESISRTHTRTHNDYHLTQTNKAP